MDTQDIRDFVQGLIQPIAGSTQLEYDRALHRLGGSHWREYADAHTLGKRAASVLRAAWRREVACRINDTCNTLALLALVSAPAPHLLCEVHRLVDILSDDLTQSSYQPPVSGKRVGGRSKRKSLRGLPPDWRDQLIEHARPDDQIPLLVMALSGCRPAELKKGIAVMSHGELLAFIIHGVKVRESAGYEYRTVAINPSTLLLGNHELVQALFATKPTVAIADDQSFQKRIKRLALRLEFKGVSCYSLRHQLAADAKAMGTGKSTLARVLGHQAERTQRYYGNHQQGNKVGRVLEIHGHTQSEPRPEMEVTPVWDKPVYLVNSTTGRNEPSD